MKVGIIPNINKPNIFDIVKGIAAKFNENGIKCEISEVFAANYSNFKQEFIGVVPKPNEELGKSCDVILSIGGDGTMLSTAYDLRNYTAPILGINVGKLGFLAEFDLKTFYDFIDDSPL